MVYASEKRKLNLEKKCKEMRKHDDKSKLVQNTKITGKGIQSKGEISII